MRRLRSIGLGLAVLSTAACAAPSVTPMTEEARKGVVSISPEVAGITHANTSNLGARGSGEGARKGAAQVMSQRVYTGNPLAGVIGQMIAAGVASAAGAANAKSEQEVDAARDGLRVALQTTDFAPILRDELGRTRGADGRVKVIVEAGAAPTAATPVALTADAKGRHLLRVNYELGLAVTGTVIPDVQVSVLAKTQLVTAEQGTVVHTGTWKYCGPSRFFTDAAADNGAAVRADARQAAAVIAEAITYDTFVATKPRYMDGLHGCMDLADLPSGNGKPVKVPRTPDPRSTQEWSDKPEGEKVR